MDIREFVKEVERNYREGQNIFRRKTVGYLLQRISELEKEAAQHRVQRTCDECGCIEGHRPSCSKFGSYVESTRR